MVDKDEIRELGLQALKNFFEINDEMIKSLNSKELKFITNKAKFGMQFEREMNIHTRSNERNIIRVCSLIAKDKAQLKKMLMAGLPRYVIGVTNK